MATQTFRGRIGRFGLPPQPIPHLAPGPTSNKRQYAKLARTFVTADAVLAAQWLNSANGMTTKNAKASYDRVVAIYERLNELQAKRTQLLKDFGPDPKAWQDAIEEMERKKEMLKAGKRPESGVIFPGDRYHESVEAYGRYVDIKEQILSFTATLNESLARYSFHCRFTYTTLPGTISILQDVWAGGMVPDKHWFQIEFDGWVISEADVVLSLCRLEATGSLAKISCCRNCKSKWFVAPKRSYRFCGDSCRGLFYLKSSEYRPQKSSSQRNHINSAGVRRGA